MPPAPYGQRVHAGDPGERWQGLATALEHTSTPPLCSPSRRSATELLKPKAQLTTPRSRRQVVFRAPRLDCDSDESVLAVTQQLRRDDSDARSRARGRKSRILKSVTLTLTTESLGAAPPHLRLLYLQYSRWGQGGGAWGLVFVREAPPPGARRPQGGVRGQSGHAPSK